MNFETESIIRQIKAVYPELVIKKIRKIEGLGQFSAVFVVDEALIFRFPRNLDTAKSMLQELAILHVLAGRTTLPIPKPIYSQTDENGLIFMGYPMLKGDNLSLEHLQDQSETVMRGIAKQLAKFLREIHSTPLSLFDSNLEIEGKPKDWQRLYEAFQAELFPYMRPDAQESVRREFETALNNSSLWDFQPVLRHGDFGLGNILYFSEKQRISGVIDFGFAGIGDPAQDVGALGSLGEKFMTHFFDFYPEMRSTIPRLKFIRSTYALQQALYALCDSNQEDFDDGMKDYI